ncbi:MAG: hypothetical protein AAF828_05980, partial [Bacteroidota bacterium]
MPRFILLCIATIFAFVLAAQPESCAGNPEMTTDCRDACIICDIDGFTGRNTGNASGTLPPGFCTFITHNPRWIAFIAGSENLTIRIDVSNCILGDGLEIGIYSGDDCNNF